MVIAALIAPIVTGFPANTFYSRSFRVSPEGPPNYVVQVNSSSQALSVGWKTTIDLIELGGNGSKKLVSSTRVDGDPRVSDISIHYFQRQKDFTDRQGRFHKHFPTPFLVTQVDYGRFDYSLVWWFNPKTMRPVQMLEALMGDARRLNKGVVEENSFSHYVDPSDWPKDVIKTHKNVHRLWKFNPDAFKFVAGAWQKG